MSMANPKPVQTEAFINQQRPKVADKALGKVIGVRFPIEVDQVLLELPDKTGYIRSAVIEKLKADGLI